MDGITFSIPTITICVLGQATDNLAFLPVGILPIVPIPKTSPILYPNPPELIVAATETPLLTVIFAVAFLPLPLIVVKFIPLKVFPEHFSYKQSFRH